MELRLVSKASTETHAITPKQLVIASWTGRDRAAMEGRLAELEAMGIPRPPSLPMFYRNAAQRLTTASKIDVIGDQTSGEAEFVMLKFGGRLWVGVGSDHTDRALEAQNASLSKQVCDKPVSNEWWAFDDLLSHWDSLRLRSYIVSFDGSKVLYQEGSVNSMLSPQSLLALWESTGVADDGAALFCGTLPAIGGVRGALRFEIELEDPALGRTLRHAYDIEVLPQHLNSTSSIPS
ncbi:DUF2848 domain-containing protein [Herbaspirillum sp. LeCh32-8]|uniref:DUF2848 domain-containing protein n=1 Tax=Herbaspirillum sp. LeCh32-8 TaxID=2821356 RepID=UPI001AE722ED|nr:DUF2848 domain-containing protein [Herbaspirillum sp. LeCh32-8]MBP0598859.1 DUF2848 domain-containing protein [Herbaspirillum sp. LeCh32-8]